MTPPPWIRRHPLGALLPLTAALFIASLSVGASGVSLAGVWADWRGGAGGMAWVIFTEIRLPRALLGLLVGGALGMAGAALQGMLRNPLAEPAVIGVSPCAALGAVIVFYSGWATSLALAVPLGGIAGALIAVALLFALAGRSVGVLTLILAGIALSSFAGAATSLALSLSPNPYALAEIVFWMMGSLADRTLDQVYLAAPFIGVGAALLLSAGPALDALSLGEDTAQSLGFPLRRVGARVVVGTALAVGAAVAVTGAIGFVGLVVPHLLRPLVGHQPRRLLLPSFAGGACLVLAADTAVRLGGPGPELKLGVVTALLGAPFFLGLVLATRRRLA
ncbi:iron ABC transporter permease [Nitrospirillum sp. BR 11828]|uniref:FecCD family ABC transporter permease n=1 Tax=Nitrospirillum sp. BR 11828 TaxID=3104325 RepID=UPI002ACAEA99|nr:iron ABC transporter permease [Nitrospirillum sp. BR 11828]MDZ5646100.1 iron ABC transporter permease [Nitrospirillum sp. BR 11828]